MSFDIVQSYAITVPEHAIEIPKRFTSPRETIGVFDDYYFWIECHKYDENHKADGDDADNNEEVNENEKSTLDAFMK